MMLAASLHANSTLFDCYGVVEADPITGELELECSGDSCCDIKSGSDDGGDYWFCGCTPTAVPECCYTILRIYVERPYEGDALGDCFAENPNCDAGTCQYMAATGEGDCD